MSLKISPPVIAHRGASAYAPENTLSAFKKAKEWGARWIEFDVMLAACGEVVVMHDETLERTTNGRGKVSEQSYAYLQTLDAGSWFHPSFSYEKIPTLKEVLLFLERNPLAANIEIKALEGKEQETVTAVLALINQHGSSLLLPLVLSSFSVNTLREVRDQSASSQLSLLIANFYAGWEKIIDELPLVALSVDQKILELASVNQLKALNKPLWCYTVNDPARALELFSWGMDAVFTDCPDKILQVL